jgi:pyridoxine kinase
MDGRVLSIQSHVVHGYVGNKVATFAIQSLGLDVDPVLSVHFSTHTGYSKFAASSNQVMQGSELTQLKEGLEATGVLDNVAYTHLLTGYIGSLSFLEAVLDVLQSVRQRNANLIYVCDPVLGDHGKLYVPEALVQCYKEKVVPHATVLTPNQFECELLTGVAIKTRQDAVTACDTLHEQGVQTVVITSLEYEHATELTVFASHKGADGGAQRYEVNMPKLDGRFTGTGDLSAALLLAWLHHTNNDVKQAVEKTMSTLKAVLERTIQDGVAIGGAPPEIKLIQSHADIVNPPNTFSCTAL